MTAKKEVILTARVVDDVEHRLSPDAFMDYVLEFLSEEGLFESFAAYVLNMDAGKEYDYSDLRDADIITP